MPINPCGMAMDLLRACYTTEMRFWKDNNLSVPIQWFFCDENAKDFPAHQLFGSGNWASPYGAWKGPGEVEDVPRPFFSGVNPGLSGQKFCGPLKGFTEGTTFPGIPLHANGAGLTPCCRPDIIPPCNVIVSLLPEVLYARIVFVTSNLISPLGQVGDEFTMTRIPGFDAWKSDRIWSNGESCFTQPIARCGNLNPEVFGWDENGAAAQPPLTFTDSPLHMFFDQVFSLKFGSCTFPPLAFENWSVEVQGVPF